MRRLVSALAALAALAIFAAVSLPAGKAAAAPLSYSAVNIPIDTPQALAGAVIGAINSNLAEAAPLVTASGTTTATAQGLRVTVSITGLSTAASTLSATMTVTNASVTAVSQVLCSVNGYSGTGVPVVVNVVPEAGDFKMAIQNVSTGAALNATVPVACAVLN